MRWTPMDKLIEARGMLHALSFIETDNGIYDALEHSISLIDDYIEKEIAAKKFNDWRSIVMDSGLPDPLLA